MPKARGLIFRYSEISGAAWSRRYVTLIHHESFRGESKLDQTAEVGERPLSYYASASSITKGWRPMGLPSLLYICCDKTERSGCFEGCFKGSVKSPGSVLSPLDQPSLFLKAPTVNVIGNELITCRFYCRRSMEYGVITLLLNSLRP